MYHPRLRGAAHTFPVLLAVLITALVAGSSADLRGQAPSPFQHEWASGTPVTVTGVLTEMYADDFAHQRSELVHTIRDEQTGRSFRLRFEREAPATGRRGAAITVSGRMRGSDIYMLADQVSSTLGTPTIGTNAATNPVVTGDQRTLVIVANFRDKTVDCLTSDIVGDLNGIMWSGTGTWPDATYNYSVDALYRDISSGQVSFSGKVVGTKNRAVPLIVSSTIHERIERRRWLTRAG
jgi:hypothetical protein